LKQNQEHLKSKRKGEKAQGAKILPPFKSSDVNAFFDIHTSTI
jgi:hypothetical protein